MALADVKTFFHQMEEQRNELKSDLADFEQGLKDGYVTEEKVEAVKAYYQQVDTNYQRLAYIMYLFSIPNRHSKKTKYDAANKKLIEQFALNKSDAEALKAENEDAIKNFRHEVEQLIKDNK